MTAFNARLLDRTRHIPGRCQRANERSTDRRNGIVRIVDEEVRGFGARLVAAQNAISGPGICIPAAVQIKALPVRLRQGPSFCGSPLVLAHDEIADGWQVNIPTAHVLVVELNLKGVDPGAGRVRRVPKRQVTQIGLERRGVLPWTGDEMLALARAFCASALPHGIEILKFVPRRAVVPAALAETGYRDMLVPAMRLQFRLGDRLQTPIEQLPQSPMARERDVRKG